MMPSHPGGHRSWTVREWVKSRKGWIFITSTPDTIDALRPVQSLWLDMLILKLCNPRSAGAVDRASGWFSMSSLL